MFSYLKNQLNQFSFKQHLKDQRSNYLLIIGLLLFSGILNGLNLVNEHERLVQTHFDRVNRVMQHDSLFMKRLMPFVSQEDAATLSSIHSTIRKKKYSPDMLIDVTRTWERIFSNALTLSAIEVLVDYESIKKAHHKLLSSILRYNLEVQRHNHYIAKPLTKLIHVHRNLAPASPISISTDLSAFKPVVL